MKVDGGEKMMMIPAVLHQYCLYVVSLQCQGAVPIFKKWVTCFNVCEIYVSQPNPEGTSHFYDSQSDECRVAALDLPMKQY